jgi:hypothetical protein
VDVAGFVLAQLAGALLAMGVASALSASPRAGREQDEARKPA